MADVSPTEPHHVLILCDYAEVINGKLYVMGGGITDVLSNQPALLSLGVLLTIPWSEANRPQQLQIELKTQDGEDVLAPDGNKVEVQGNVEVGRPPGSVHGASFPAALGIRLPPLMLKGGQYRFELHLNGGLEEVVAFRVKP